MNVTYENPAYDVQKSYHLSLNRDFGDDDDDGTVDLDNSHYVGRDDESVGVMDKHSPPNGNGREIYREMAVDCPSDFRPYKKEPLRMPENHHSAYANDIKSTEDAELEKRVKMYQNDLKKRREMEEKQMTEEEFLRTSLRGSKKLQALEKKRKIEPRGLENAAFLDDDSSVSESPRPATMIALSSPDHHWPADESHTDGEQPCDVEKLIVCFNNVRSKIRDNKHDKNFLVQFFQNPKLQLSVAIHEKILDVTDPLCLRTPVCHNARTRCQEIYAELPTQTDAHVRELKSILCKARFQSLLYTHDRVACQYSMPCDEDELEEIHVEPVVTNESETDVWPVADLNQITLVNNDRRLGGEMAVDVPAGFEEQNRFQNNEVRIVRLLKTAEPLGATVKNDGDSVLVARIVQGGLVEQSGLLKEGDEILEVNGQDIRGYSVNEVSDMLASMSGPITFCVIPSIDEQTSRKSHEISHIRALFNYDPEDDNYIPCRELGLGFRKCDVLHVINQEDANWWQAYREGEEAENQLAGLIPSRTFQEQREAMKQVISAEDGIDERSGTCCKRKKKKKQKLYSTENEPFDAESVPTYEEVALYYPQPNRKRPVVLIGPPNVGRQELRQRLMESDSNRFAAAVPHTSRPRKDSEKDGVDYHFIPRQLFETDILQNKFIEHGEYEQNLYGTSIAAVQGVIDAGKVCLLNVHPQSLKALKSSRLKPYVFFVAPPNLEKLRMNCHKQGLKLSEDGLKDIITRGREIEEVFGHYFDYCMINYEIDRTFDEVMAEINRLDLEPQWVPSKWLYD